MAKVNSRSKGKRGELEFRDALREFGIYARRGQQFAGNVGGISPDVVHSLPGIHFEVKRTERLDLVGAMAQAKADAGSKVPVVVNKRNKGEWLATVPAEILLGWLVELFPESDFSDL